MKEPIEGQRITKKGLGTMLDRYYRATGNTAMGSLSIMDKP